MYRKTCGALLLALLPAAASAQTTVSPAPSPERVEGRGKLRIACEGDVQKFCANVERGKGGAMRTCLWAHQSDLSAACKAARAERSAVRAKEKI